MLLKRIYWRQMIWRRFEAKVSDEILFLEYL